MTVGKLLLRGFTDLSQTIVLVSSHYVAVPSQASTSGHLGNRRDASKLGPELSGWDPGIQPGAAHPTHHCDLCPMKSVSLCFLYKPGFRFHAAC